MCYIVLLLSLNYNSIWSLKTILTAFIKANKALEIKPVRGQLKLITLTSIGQEREYHRHHFSALIVQQWSKWLSINVVREIQENNYDREKHEQLCNL